MPVPPPAFVEELSSTLPPGTVHDDDGRLTVAPSTTADVAAVVRSCASAGVAIVARGGDTGLSGGTIPPDDRPSILLSLSRLNRIVSVDPDRWTITAESGVTVEAVQEAAARVDRQFAPDWGARGTATVGGAIATDAGGNNVVRYGNMRDNVLGIEVVTADGRVWDGLRALRKDSSGYDLKQLFIGSEGTLGIVTSAVLRLVPATPHQQSAFAAIRDLRSLTPLLELAQSTAPGVLIAFELVPDVGVERVHELYGWPRPIETAAEYHVLLKLASADPVTDRLTNILATGSERGHIIDAVVAATPEQEAALWRMRDELSPTRTYPEHQHLGLKLDTAVPLDRIAEFIERVNHTAAEIAPMALCYGFGHVGDGNIHMMILPTTDDAVETFLTVRPALEAAIDALVFELDGTLSAEHGLGLLLRDRVAPQKPAIEWEMMRTIKAALDPDDIFNPGKVIPAP